MSESCFSPNYQTARQRFRDAAAQASALNFAIPLDASGPEGLDLTIDIAWLGSRDPQRILVVQSGVHGVEGFSGSAIQLALLEAPPVMGAGTALLLIHAVNPYGFAWLRRANENNVDLNRNCLLEGEVWSGAPAGYRKLLGLINPPSPPARDGFFLRAGLAVLRHGFDAIKQAVAGGQYDYPEGLFYGGRALEQGSDQLRRWLADHVGQPRRVMVIDVHTGLGRRGKETLMLDRYSTEEDLHRLRDGIGAPLLQVQSGNTPGYAIRGGVVNLYRQVFADDAVIYMTQEFGTHPPMRVLHALREENRRHFHSRQRGDHPAKQRLADCMSPPDPRWQRRVVATGTSRVHKALTVLESLGSVSRQVNHG